MARHKIKEVLGTIRGDGTVKVKTGYKSVETVYCRKSEIEKLKDYFSVDDINDLEGKVFEFTSDRYYVKRNVFKHFLKTL